LDGGILRIKSGKLNGKCAINGNEIGCEILKEIDGKKREFTPRG
jgi:hypothetical protein